MPLKLGYNKVANKLRRTCACRNINKQRRRNMNHQNTITETKLALIRKILDAKLTKAELQAVISKAETIVNARNK